ncbi:MAG: 23S rRNA (uracil(1939)-C(5))-methyltransferase RlmD [Candidatus Riflebacteria bacterium]|nr:23S rRNA (uracil(1939)-C(5))-methyltransferase RlmD [Candidatus Riflebacteria bacterium]
MENIVIDRMTYGIDALGRLNGKVVFVPYAAPGDELSVEITEEKTDYSRAKIVEILKPSKSRQKSNCPNFPECGGCHWLHLYDEVQRREKDGYLTFLLKPLSPGDVYPIEPLSSEKYRNKMELKIAKTADGKILLGNYKFHSHEVVSLKGCRVQLPQNMQMYDALVEFVNSTLMLPFANNITEISLRTLGEQQHCLFLLKTQPPEEILNTFRDFFNSRATLSKLEVQSESEIFLTLMRDKPPFSFMNRTWTVSPNSFFQNNLEGAEAIFYTLQSIYESIPQKGKFIDFYCGVGIQTMLLEKMFEEVVAVEANENSYHDAIKNQKGRRPQQLRFLCRKAESIFNTPFTKGTIAALHVNPPRSGISQKVMRGLMGIRPKLITYLSCNPITFRRDAQGIIQLGYKLDQVYAFDLFPGTFHLEILASFSR